MSRVDTTALRSEEPPYLITTASRAYVLPRCGASPGVGWGALVLLSFPCHSGRNGFRDICGLLGREKAGDRVVWVQVLATPRSGLPVHLSLLVKCLLVCEHLFVSETGS